MRCNPVFLLFFLTIILSLSGCQAKKDIYITNGELVLNPNDELVRLNGEWNFYWNQLLSPNDLYSREEAIIPEKIQNPGYWKERSGYGTYQLTMHFPENKVGQPLALFLPKVYTAYRLWINDNLYKENGKVAKTEKDMVSLGIPKIIYFTPSKQEVSVLIQVSNFNYRKAGISGSIFLGNPENIERIIKRQTLLEWFSIGALFIISVNQLTLYMNRKKDQISLLLGVFALLVGFRVLLKGNTYIFDLFPNFDWDLAVKFDYLILFLGFPIFIKYFSLLFPNESKEKVLLVSICLSSVCITLVLLTSTEIFTHTILVFQIMLFLVVPYLFYVLFKAVLNRQEGAIIISILFFIFIASVINDLLHNEQIIYTMQLTSLGLAVFFGAQSYIVAKKFSRTLTEVEELSYEIDTTQREIIFTLGEITETRSNETGNHVRRVAEYSKLLSLKYGLPSQEAELVKMAAPMHDVGKVGIPDSILNKPGKLTEEEFDIVKTHTTIGYQMLKHSKRKLIEVAAVIAYSHHEKYNGKGYPRGLKGEEIPLYGRIVAIADVFDALSTDRVYKKAWDIDQIVQFFKEEKGKHFDPVLVEIFLENVNGFIMIKETFKVD